MDEPHVVAVPFLDTGLGREAGYRDDAELIAAARERRAEIERLVSPDLLARLDAAEAQAIEDFVFGTTRVR